MQRHDKRMVLTMGAVIASVALVSGLGTVPGDVQASHVAGHQDPILRLRCTYDVGNGGDVFASMQEDLNGVSDDSPGSYIDQGGCIINPAGLGQCYTTVTRATGGIGDAMGDLTLDFMADGMTVSTADAQEENATLDCNVREIDFGSLPDTVSIRVLVQDDFWETYVDGVLCTDSTDDDQIACEEAQLGSPEINEPFCDGQLSEATNTVDLTSTDHIVVFLDGPANEGINGCNNGNPTGAVTGGVVVPGYGVIIEFYE